MTTTTMKISVEGMKFYAYHGYYEEEQLLGNYYIVDVWLKIDFSRAGQNDDLKDTLNYESIYKMTERVMRKKVKLLEVLGEKIASGLKQQFNQIEEISVTIKKLNPPFGGDVQHSSIEIIKNYEKL